jgi:transposase-like protein
LSSTSPSISYYYIVLWHKLQNLNEKEENYRLKVENAMLSDENKKLKQAHGTTFCPTCDPASQNQLTPDMQRLKEQNNWLKLEVQNIKKTTRHFRLSLSKLTFG